jgi:hypothetical protein
MRTTRFLSLSAAVLMSGVLLAGCGSSAADRPTILVTETASASADPSSEPAATTTGTAPAATTSGGSADASTVDETTPASTDGTTAGSSESVAPVVTVDPLKADCTKVLNPTELGRSFGQLPAGTNRILEAANPEREITGRLKCQYGVEGERIAVQVVLAQFTSQAAAEAQRELTATSERQAGADDSTTTVLGHPADILLRDGGLIVVGYDTWTLSVVADAAALTEDKLPAALEATAEYALNQVILNG